MITLERTNSHNPDFINLVKNLDAEIAERDGDDHSFYAQFNTINKINYVVMAYENKRPVGCGGIKEYDTSTMEVKRMFVSPERRGKGIASRILTALEGWASELSIRKCILETGKRQPEAIRLYEKNGYKLIPNYDQYAGVENSVCFRERINVTQFDYMAILLRNFFSLVVLPYIP